MENFTLENILLALLGMALHICMNVLQRKNRKKSVSIRYFVRDFKNWIRIAIVTISIIVLFITANDVADILGITLSNGSPAKSIFAFFIGYFNHSLIKNILKIVGK